MNKLPVPIGKASPATVSPLQLYLREIAKYPLLDPEQEFELAKDHFEHQNLEAAHRLVTSNLRLVVKIASDFRRVQGDLLDLIQEGNAGLMQAVKKFNPYKGVKLSSYAVWWIRAYILKYLMDQKSHVKIATTAAQRKLFYNLKKEAERLLLEYETVDPKKIAASLQVPEKDVIEMQKRLGSYDVSLDAPLHGADGENSLKQQDVLYDEHEEPIDEFLANEQIRQLFDAYLIEFEQTLKGRDLEIFKERLLSESPLSLQELGDKYGVTRERARQIEARIIKNLRLFVDSKKTLKANYEPTQKHLIETSLPKK